jgi:hypothetical protein
MILFLTSTIKIEIFLYVYIYFKNWECHLFKKYKIGNIVGGIQLSLKTNATRIYIVQYTTRCVKTLIKLYLIPLARQQN